MLTVDQLRNEVQAGRVDTVILALTDMVDRAKIVPDAARAARTRDVILWCVEAYFGQRGGAPVGGDREASAGATAQETPGMGP